MTCEQVAATKRTHMHENTDFFCAPPSPGTNRRQVSLAVLLEIDECMADSSNYQTREADNSTISLVLPG